MQEAVPEVVCTTVRAVPAEVQAYTGVPGEAQDPILHQHPLVGVADTEGLAPEVEAADSVPQVLQEVQEVLEALEALVVPEAQEVLEVQEAEVEAVPQEVVEAAAEEEIKVQVQS